MIYQHVNWDPNKRDLRIFSIALACLFTVITVVSWTRTGTFGKVQIVLAIAGVSILLTGLLFPKSLHWPYKIWMVAMAPVGFVLQTTMLLLFYYLILGTTGLFFRLFGKDPLERKFDQSAKTYWKDVKNTKNIRSYFKQY